MSSLSVTPTGWEPFEPWRKVALGWEILADYVRMRYVLRRGTVAETVSWLREPAARTRPSRDDAADLTLAGVRLGRVVVRTLLPLPTDSRCLMRSLVLLRMMARRGVACQLVIGVSPAPEFRAHAWVELAGEPLLDSGGDEFARLLEL